MPWRSGRNAYRVVVSEFMLQQTRAETAAPYYERWLRRFPDWDAPADDVVREWQGLGYYARARNLQRTALIVRDRFGGVLPSEPGALRELPGVGEYTAAAVASIVHGEPVAAVDGNVRRVLARLLDLADPAPARLGREASHLLDPNRPGDFNEAMMELGATVCLPRAPRCGACPVADFCRARAAGTAARRPVRRPARRLREAGFVSVAFVDPAGRTLLVRRPAKGLLAGMWEFPGVELTSGSGGSRPAGERPGASPSPGRGPGSGSPSSEQLASLARRRLAELGIRAVAGAEPELLEPVRHVFTHFRATYHPVIVVGGRSGTGRKGEARSQCDIAGRDDAGRARPGAQVRTPEPSDDARMAPACASGFRSFALPVAQQKIAARLERWLAARRTTRPG